MISEEVIFAHGPHQPNIEIEVRGLRTEILTCKLYNALPALLPLDLHAQPMVQTLQAECALLKIGCAYDQRVGSSVWFSTSSMKRTQ
jgi:hypothetical protein